MQIHRYALVSANEVAEVIDTDVLIIGSGIAGLSAALAAAETRRVLLVCKGELHDSNTWHAQGGIAVPTPDTHDIESHINDTMRVACGLAKADVVEGIIRAAPEAVERLVARGVSFDLDGGGLARTREGGHSRSRVLHARGDATGLELGAALSDAVRRTQNIRLLQDAFVMDLLTRDDRCIGATVLMNGRRSAVLYAAATILATGGAGEVFRYTTNPPGATADGAAMALRAGAVLADMEFMQFHPTALQVGMEPLPLISEALRGEGARLVDAAGRRFMPEYHVDGELAPRDVVSRAIFEEMRRGACESVFLDVRHWPPEFMPRRFPGVYQSCQSHGIDPARQAIPVRPAAHYMIGGVKVDCRGRSTLNGLFASGEASCSGMHGANRLASNSLLEALVLGEVCGRAAAESTAFGETVHRLDLKSDSPGSKGGVAPNEAEIASWRRRLRNAAWENIGIVRSKSGIDAMLVLAEQALTATANGTPTCSMIELRNIAMVSAMIALAASLRTESRGVHFRADYPQCNDALRRRIELRLFSGELTATWEP